MKTGLRHKDAGSFIPKVTFTDVESKTHFISVKYEDWRESSKTMKKIKKHLKEQVTEKIVVKEKKKIKKPIYHTWKNLEGKIIKAQFIQLSDDNVVFKMRSGKQVKYPLQKLSNQSQELAKSLDDSLNNKQEQ